eukprot:TRINITY_DN3375_c0_g1_i10.p1 TRINITY_DN3375_c0_g1~~TRINITY_DN3375_c0_g1_i10.p1  ORF type:complete len:517 (+),score=118.81 TRINITY_DN3375_c0_g1_i10:274-1824(+)
MSYKWYYSDSGKADKWIEYDVDIAEKLERSFGKSQKTVKLNKVRYVDLTDPDKLVEKSYEDDKKQIAVKRELETTTTTTSSSAKRKVDDDILDDSVVQWKWAGDGKTGSQSTWINYDKDIAEQIEKAYKKGQKTVKIDKERYIDLNDPNEFLQRRYDDPNKRRLVKREDPESKKVKTAPSSSSSTTTTTKPPLSDIRKGIESFYSEYAGMHDEISTTKRDAFSNPEGSDFDLGKEGAFDKFTILVGNFFSGINEKSFLDMPGKKLKQKGFGITYTADKDVFFRHLESGEVDIAFIISSGSGYPIPDRSGFTGFPGYYGGGKKKKGKAPAFAFAPMCGNLGEFTDQELAKVEAFHKSGAGLYLWADNQPYITTANQVLNYMFPTNPGLILINDVPGGQDLKVGDAYTKGQFGRHLITSGVVNLCEGYTICHPTNERDLGPFEVLGTGTDGHPCLLYAEQVPSGKLPPNCGRIVIDTGFTKLYHMWEKTAGTSRYILNACVWLFGLDHKVRIGAPLHR